MLIWQIFIWCQCCTRRSLSYTLKVSKDLSKTEMTGRMFQAEGTGWTNTQEWKYLEWWGNIRYFNWTAAWLSIILGLEADQGGPWMPSWGIWLLPFTSTLSVLSINLLTLLHLIVWLWDNYFICEEWCHGNSTELRIKGLRFIYYTWV